MAVAAVAGRPSGGRCREEASNTSRTRRTQWHLRHPRRPRLSLGADPTVADIYRFTPCMYAARSGSVPCLRALVSGGPGGALVGDAVNAQTADGDTALDFADHAEFAVVLEELGGR